MDYQKPKEKIDPQAATAWRVAGVLYVLFFLSLMVVFSIISYYFGPSPRWIAYTIGGLGMVTGIFSVGIIPAIRMRYWCYEIREHEVDIQYGIIVIRRSLVPIARIQHVDTEQGPILRRFNLATLSISTAGTTHKIPALRLPRALELRDLISSLAKMSDDDV